MEAWTRYPQYPDPALMSSHGALYATGGNGASNKKRSIGQNYDPSGIVKPPLSKRKSGAQQQQQHEEVGSLLYKLQSQQKVCILALCVLVCICIHVCIYSPPYTLYTHCM